MLKTINSFVFYILICCILPESVFSKNTNIFSGICISQFAPPAPPVVIKDQYYCINDVVILSAIPASGGFLNWYGTNATGGTRSAIAPTASTSVKGLTTYYVSQTVAGEESIRTPINVNVNAQLDLFCDGSKTTSNSVAFDFANVGQTSYTYSYTISGGTPVTGVWSSPSNFVVNGVMPGQSVSFTITAIGAPSCVDASKTAICNSTCASTQIVKPDFSTTPTVYCLNDVVVLPPKSTDGIDGAWTPLTVNTSSLGKITYTFTPSKILFPCALVTTLPIAVEPLAPDFSDFPICSGTTPPALNTIDSNGITGTWNPPIIDNFNSRTYIFTPDSGQPCTPANKTITVTVNPSNTIVNLNWTTTNAFSKNQIVTVTDPIGSSYVYQMDSGPFQASSIFENVASGIHSITVKDVNGCSEFTESNILIVGYPKYFTPNGDNINDTWNIVEMGELSSNSRIYIFDRYGKLLKDISPSDPSGWDGTYIGQPMPADDYWFTVEYTEQNSIKKFKSHFSLKR